MAEMSIAIRQMSGDDLPSVLEIQKECYTELEPESRESLEAKLAASPESCFVALVGHQIVAYLFSIPFKFGDFPDLDARTCTLPPDPECLYLHDLAVSIKGRGSGIGRRLIKKYLDLVRTMNLKGGSLIAVQHSEHFWLRFGFQPAEENETLKKKLLRYGSGAVRMEMKC